MYHIPPQKNPHPLGVQPHFLDSKSDTFFTSDAYAILIISTLEFLAIVLIDPSTFSRSETLYPNFYGQRFRYLVPRLENPLVT